MADAPRLQWADYLVFALMLVASASIGVYYNFRGHSSKGATSDYLVGGRELSFVPVTISLTVSFISAILFLGYPADTFAFGSQWWLVVFGVTLGAILAAVLYVPLIYPLKLTSINEYLEMRFESQTVKMIGTFTSISAMIFYCATVFYGPATAAEAVTGFPTWGSILIVSVVSIFYTTLGGIRAVIWTDVFQAFIMFVGMITVVIQSVVIVGNGAKILEINDRWERLNWIDINPDPTQRLNFWGLTIATALTFSGVYGTGQMAVQRYSSLPSLKIAICATIGIIPGTAILTSLACFCGLAVFAYYAQVGCDPLSNHDIQNANQIMLYFAVDVLNAPGIPGLFMAAVWAGSLSTVSSALNSAAANLWEDVIKQRISDIDDLKASRIIKGLVCGFGVLASALAFLLSKARSSTIVELMGTFVSAMVGPSKGLVFLAGYVPWTNWIGASVGSLTSFIFGLWVAIGSVFHKHIPDRPPSPTYNCNANYTGTTMQSFIYDHSTTSVVDAIPSSEPTGLTRLYSISFLWLPVFTIIINVVVAIIVSFLTGHRDAKSVPPRLLHPFTRWWLGVKSVEEEPLSKKGEAANQKGITNPSFVWTSFSSEDRLNLDSILYVSSV